MTIEGFAARLQQMRKAYPEQVLCAFHYPDGLEVFVPVSPELMEEPDTHVGRLLMQMVQRHAAEARTWAGR